MADKKSLNSFGVSGLLDPGCKVYYDNLFSSRHIGRVSDLICVHLREQGLDELRLRAILLFAFFEGYRAQQGSSKKEGLLEPLVLECGIDQKKVALGVVFRSSAVIESQGLSERIVSGKPNGAFEKLLWQLYEEADGLIIRVLAGVQIELVMLISAKGAATHARLAPEVVVMKDRSSVAEAPSLAQYIQLGDTDYVQALKSETPAKAAPGGKKPSPDQAGLEECTELEKALRSRARGGAAEKGPQGPQSVDTPESEVFVVKGTDEDLIDPATATVHGKGSKEKVQRGEGPFGSILKKVFSFGKRKNVPDQEPFEDSAGEPPATPVQSSAEGPKLAPLDSIASAEEAASGLIAEIESGPLTQALQKAQEDFKEVKRDIPNAKARAWMEGFMGDVMQEKARLGEFSRNLTAAIRQKEHEFKAKEMQLQEELRRRDEALRQRDFALLRAKDQLGIVNMTIEKLKSTQQEKGEDAFLKQKVTTTQKLLASAKEDNVRLQKKVEELKGQLNTAQTALKTKSTGTSAPNELAAFKLKYDRLAKQSEDLRKMNEQLTERIQHLAGHKQSNTAVEKHLEAAMKQVANAQRESDQFKLRVEELQREEQRLKVELKRAELEVKNLKNAAANRAVPSGKPPKAA